MLKFFIFCCILNLTITIQAKSLTIPKTTLAIKAEYLHLLNASGSQIIISKKQVKQSGAKTLTQLLQNTSAIHMFYSNDPSTPTISMRGFGDNATANTLILLNGFPLQSPDMSNDFLNLVPINEIQSIIISPESAGVLYGNNAVGGVINIITSQPKKFSAGIRLGAGSYDGNSQQVYIGNKLGNFHYLLSAKN